ncbi:ABC transporter ATP-binding protein [Bombilactobacillus bombi]|uniref:ABC transporter ATP-binding protein n=1 Tax=Bombilactobacillus bombi TaxID=1303590 RepID=UPI0015E61057|nr:ABC transporter ATP-binding protein [Bombilactobacillus bombi]MBA1435291.1 ABC transporter ATP-binding protein [Bombilactobacillus bombi]
MDSIYKINHVFQKYKKNTQFSNEDINLDIPSGKVIGFFGENGAGKSTLVEAMIGYRKVERGEILFQGVEVEKQPDKIRQTISYSTQAPLPLGFMTVHKILLTTAMLRGKNKIDAQEQVNEWMQKLDLTDFKNKNLSSLSGGQRRIVGFATAIVGNYNVLILDEPTNELDPEKRKLVWNSIKEINKRNSVTIIVVTHDVNESEKYIDEAVLFSKGRVIATGEPSYFKNISQNKYKLILKLNSRNISITQNKLNQLGYGFEMLKENRLQISIEKRDLLKTLDEIINQASNLDFEEYTVSAPTLNDSFDFFREKA